MANNASSEHVVSQIRSEIANSIQSITRLHVIGFILGAGMAIPPATTSIETSLGYLLFVMVILYLAALGSRFEERSLLLEFAVGMWASLGTVYLIAMWYYLSQQISLFPFGMELIP